MISLQTKRLCIRDHIPQDLDTHHALFSDLEAMWYLQDIMTHSLEASRENLQMAIDAIDDPGRRYYFLRMEARDTGEHIGEIGYTVKEILPSGKVVDVGYFIRKAHWGKGYTPEAFRALLHFAFEEDGVACVRCGCLVENAKSERVMQKCGLRRVGIYKGVQAHDGQMKDRVSYELLREEWIAAQPGPSSAAPGHHSVPKEDFT